MFDGVPKNNAVVSTNLISSTKNLVTFRCSLAIFRSKFFIPDPSISLEIFKNRPTFFQLTISRCYFQFNLNNFKSSFLHREIHDSLHYSSTMSKCHKVQASRRENACIYRENISCEIIVFSAVPFSGKVNFPR